MMSIYWIYCKYIKQAPKQAIASLQKAERYKAVWILETRRAFRRRRIRRIRNSSESQNISPHWRETLCAGSRQIGEKQHLHKAQKGNVGIWFAWAHRKIIYCPCFISTQVLPTFQPLFKLSLVWISQSLFDEPHWDPWHQQIHQALVGLFQSSATCSLCLTPLVQLVSMYSLYLRYLHGSFKLNLASLFCPPLDRDTNCITFEVTTLKAWVL